MHNFDEKFHLFDYLKNKQFDENELFEIMRYTLENKIYYYGSQFKTHSETKSLFKTNWKEYILFVYSLLQASRNHRQDTKNVNVLSSSYIKINNQLKELQYSVFSPPWSVSRDMLSDWYTFNKISGVKSDLQKLNFNELIQNKFLANIFELKNVLEKYFRTRDIRGIILPHDMDFFEKLSIGICKKLNIPTINYTHGTLHNFFNLIDDNRTDYLIVWGEKTKEAFEKMGFNKNKIFVAGHPKYQKLPKKLEFNFENILVITKAMNGGQFSDKIRVMNRGNCILYLYSVQNVLKQLGIKHASFRPHPSESTEWYQKFIDNEFYKPAPGLLKQELQSATLVIGPISTTIVESLYYEKNYVIYEPTINGINMLGLEPTPPIDGSDDRIPNAITEEELLYILKNKIKVEIDVFSDYVKVPFDISFIKGIFK